MKKRTAASLALGTCPDACLRSFSRLGTAGSFRQAYKAACCGRASNSNADQNLKLKIKDEILLYLRPILEEAGSSDEAAEIVSENLENISAVAENTGKKYGRSVTVKSEIKKEAFPTRDMIRFRFRRDIIRPCRVTIDGGAGKNWWMRRIPGCVRRPCRGRREL